MYKKRLMELREKGERRMSIEEMLTDIAVPKKIQKKKIVFGMK